MDTAQIINGVINATGQPRDQITILDIRDRNITELPLGIFDQLVNLQILSLYNNRITNLPPNIFDQLVNLQTLWLDNNQITNIPPNIFDQLTNLQYLNISSTQIIDLPEYIFDNIIKLQVLYLGGNPALKYIHESTLQYLQTHEIKIWKNYHGRLFNINTLEVYNDNDHGCKGMMN